MAHFPDSTINSLPLISYIPQNNSSGQIRFPIESIKDRCLQSSFETQFADCRLHTVSIWSYSNADKNYVEIFFRIHNGSFVQKKENSLVPASIRALILAGAFPTPQITSTLPSPFAGTMIELVDGIREGEPCTIRETVHRTMENLDYNGLPPFNKTIEQMNKGAPFQETIIDSREEEPGSTCVGMSHALLKQLKENHNIHGMFASQRLQGQDAFGHAAVMIQCDDGYVLLDPRDNPDLRIIMVPFEGITKQGAGVFSPGSRGSSIPLTVTYTNDQREEEVLEYCTHIANGDDLIMKHFMMEAPFVPPNNPAFPISAWKPKGGSNKTIWVSLLQAKITFKNMTLDKEDPERTTEISFHKIEEGKLHSRLERFYTNGMPTFHTPLESLEKQILTFVTNASMIDTIFNEIY